MLQFIGSILVFLTLWLMPCECCRSQWNIVTLWPNWKILYIMYVCYAGLFYNFVYYYYLLTKILNCRGF